MEFNTHTNLIGQHAFLSASKHSWINYEPDKLDRMFIASLAAKRGTELHKLAHDLIRLKVKLPRNQKTLSSYVNDAIGYRMRPEQILYFSENCFGTTDAISFKHNLLRIHDLKNGIIPASMSQLEVYAALFSMEYRIKPFEIETEMRIYQNDEIIIQKADPDVITHIMSKIVTFDKRITHLKAEASP